MRVTVTVYVEVMDREGLELKVTADVSPKYPAITHGPSDNWREAEGGDVESVEIHCPEFPDVTTNELLWWLTPDAINDIEIHLQQEAADVPRDWAARQEIDLG